jgi:hypothetical protein
MKVAIYLLTARAFSRDTCECTRGQSLFRVARVPAALLAWIRSASTSAPIRERQDPSKCASIAAPPIALAFSPPLHPRYVWIHDFLKIGCSAGLLSSQSVLFLLCLFFLFFFCVCRETANLRRPLFLSFRLARFHLPHVPMTLCCSPPLHLGCFRWLGGCSGDFLSYKLQRQHAADEDPQQPEDLDEPSTAVLAQPTAAALAALIPGLAHSFVPSPGAADDMRYVRVCVIRVMCASNNLLWCFSFWGFISSASFFFFFGSFCVLFFFFGRCLLPEGSVRNRFRACESGGGVLLRSVIVSIALNCNGQ